MAGGRGGVRPVSSHVPTLQLSSVLTQKRNMTVIRVENLSKSYRLGTIGTGTFFRDFERWFARVRGKPDPYARIGEADHGNRDGDEVWALRDVSFEVEQGEVLGIIGRNGAGKSTLLKILSRVTAPTSGQIKVKGRVASLLEVGTGFHPELTGRENIYLNGAILGMTREEVRRKLDEIVDFAGVETYIDTPVKRYSSGMYVRLAFAVAAHLEPEILVVDEVLAVGDAEFQKKCLGKMSKVARGGRTVLFVSHNMGAIQSLCKSVIWIHNGHLHQRGDPQGIITTYLSHISSNTSLWQKDRKIKVDRVELRNGANELTTTFAPGDSIDIKIYYTAPERFEKPYIWLSVNGMGGGIFGANMFIDGRRPDYLDSPGYIGCRFSYVPLLPQSYSITMAIRNKYREALFEPQEVASFYIVGTMSQHGMLAETADIYAQFSVPLILPYEWYYSNGTKELVRLTTNNSGKQYDLGQ